MFMKYSDQNQLSLLYHYFDWMMYSHFHRKILKRVSNGINMFDSFTKFFIHKFLELYYINSLLIFITWDNDLSTRFPLTSVCL